MPNPILAQWEQLIQKLDAGTDLVQLEIAAAFRTLLPIAEAAVTYCAQGDSASLLNLQKAAMALRTPSARYQCRAVIYLERGYSPASAVNAIEKTAEIRALCQSLGATDTIEIGYEFGVADFPSAPGVSFHVYNDTQTWRIKTTAPQPLVFETIIHYAFPDGQIREVEYQLL